MVVNEFTHSHSDDLIYLRQGREALLHRKLINAVPMTCNAAFCRLFVVFAISSLEGMLEQWMNKFNLLDLTFYFDSKNKISNKERKTRLHQTFMDAEINAEIDVLDDFLAMKYLRNTIVHQRWLDSERDWVVSRGFPNTVMSLTEEHWERMQVVEQKMMLYIACLASYHR